MSQAPSPSVIPVENPTQPFWRTELHQLDQLRTTSELPQQSDIVIIGAGYSGISLAYHLLKQLCLSDQNHPAITILDARQICSGATGRNGLYIVSSITWTIPDVNLGGHLRPDLYGNIPKFIERHGIEAGAEVANFELAHIPALKKLMADEDIDCDFNLTRCMNVYLNEADGEMARQKYEALVAQGLEYTTDIHYTSQTSAEKVCFPKACLGSITTLTPADLWSQRCQSMYLLHGGHSMAL